MAIEPDKISLDNLVKRTRVIAERYKSLPNPLDSMNLITIDLEDILKDVNSQIVGDYINKLIEKKIIEEYFNLFRKTHVKYESLKLEESFVTLEAVKLYLVRLGHNALNKSSQAPRDRGNPDKKISVEEFHIKATRVMGLIKQYQNSTSIDKIDEITNGIAKILGSMQHEAGKGIFLNYLKGHYKKPNIAGADDPSFASIEAFRKHVASLDSAYKTSLKYVDELANSVVEQLQKTGTIEENNAKTLFSEIPKNISVSLNMASTLPEATKEYFLSKVRNQLLTAPGLDVPTPDKFESSDAITNYQNALLSVRLGKLVRTVEDDSIKLRGQLQKAPIIETFDQLSRHTTSAKSNFASISEIARTFQIQPSTPANIDQELNDDLNTKETSLRIKDQGPDKIPNTQNKPLEVPTAQTEDPKTQDPKLKSVPLKGVDILKQLNATPAEISQAQAPSPLPAKEKNVPNPTIRTGEMFSSFELEKHKASIQRRLEKIALKSGKLSVNVGFDKAGWDEHLNKAKIKIEKLSSLKFEMVNKEDKFEQTYKKEKLNKTGQLKYSKEDRYYHAFNKAELYADTTFTSGSPPHYVIEHKDTGGKPDMKVVTQFHPERKKVEILSELQDRGDLYVLHMVEQAHMICKKMEKEGRPKESIVITISNCQDNPEAAIKLEEALKTLHLTSKMTPDTLTAVQAHKAKENYKPPNLS